MSELLELSPFSLETERRLVIVADWLPPGTASYHIFQTFGASRRIARGPILSWSYDPAGPFVSSGFPG